jgi:hypothetical protein
VLGLGLDGERHLPFSRGRHSGTPFEQALRSSVHATVHARNKMSDQQA